MIGLNRAVIATQIATQDETCIYFKEAIGITFVLESLLTWSAYINVLNITNRWRLGMVGRLVQWHPKSVINWN